MRPFDPKIREAYFGDKRVADLEGRDFSVLFLFEIERAFWFARRLGCVEAAELHRRLANSQVLAEGVITSLRQRKPFLIWTNS